MPEAFDLFLLDFALGLRQLRVCFEYTSGVEGIAMHRLASPRRAIKPQASEASILF